MVNFRNLDPQSSSSLDSRQIPRRRREIWQLEQQVPTKKWFHTLNMCIWHTIFSNDYSMYSILWLYMTTSKSLIIGAMIVVSK